MPSQISQSNGHPKKLFGRAFYESLGSPKLILAPMVDQSEFAWRLLTRSFMPSEDSKNILAYTPMFHARMFTETPKFRDHHFEPLKSGLPSLSEGEYPSEFPAHELHLDGNPSCDRPLFVQFCANSPDDLFQAAQYVQPFCDAIDLNLGCPQGIARKGHYGAFLQEDWDTISKLISKIHKELDIPITAKMRILETKEKTLDYAKMILSAGASIITVHGRQRDQKGHNTGLADWTAIRYLRAHLPPDTVIFANGNILQHDDIARCLEATGADGVMSAEGNLNDPSIFAEPPPIGQEGREYWRGKDGTGGYRMDAVFRRYLDIIHKHCLQQAPPARNPLFILADAHTTAIDSAAASSSDSDEPPRKRAKHGKPERCTSPNLLAMQAHLFHLLRPLVAKHHDVRDALARCRAGDMDGYERILRMVEDATKQGLLDYERGVELDPPPERADEADGGSRATVARCRRPWWVCQPYVRPSPAEALQKGAMQISKKDLAKMEQEAASKAGAEAAAKPKSTDNPEQLPSKRLQDSGFEIDHGAMHSANVARHTDSLRSIST